MSKLALKKILLASYGIDPNNTSVSILRRATKRFHLVGFIHDEALVMTPGECKLNLERSWAKSEGEDDGLFYPVYDVPEQALMYGLQIQALMMAAAREILQDHVPAAVDFAFAPYWEH